MIQSLCCSRLSSWGMHTFALQTALSVDMSPCTSPNSLSRESGHSFTAAKFILKEREISIHQWVTYFKYTPHYKKYCNTPHTTGSPNNSPRWECENENVLRENISIWVRNELKLASLPVFCRFCCTEYRRFSNFFSGWKSAQPRASSTLVSLYKHQQASVTTKLPKSPILSILRNRNDTTRAIWQLYVYFGLKSL